MAGIQSLHDRLDAIENVVRTTVDDGPASLTGPRRCPRGGGRPTARPAGRWRWPRRRPSRCSCPSREGCCSCVPGWVLPAVQGLLLVGLVAANPRRINRESRVLRSVSLTLVALLSVANAWSATALVLDIARDKGPATAGPLLVTGLAIWLTNIIVFAFWYWELDQGGPVARALATGSPAIPTSCSRP